MKKNTLINVIDEEFADDKEMSWLIDVYLKAFTRNDSHLTDATPQYWKRSKLVRDVLSQLYNDLKEYEKEDKQYGVRILHKRPKVDES